MWASIKGHSNIVKVLLENGANTSFVNRLQDEQVPVADIVADPVAKVAALAAKPHPRIPLRRLGATACLAASPLRTPAPRWPPGGASGLSCR